MHQTIKLHQKLGKPIPDIKAVEGSTDTKKPNIVKTTPLKMNFVGGTKLTSTGTEEKIETSKDGEESTEQEVPVEGTPVGKNCKLYLAWFITVAAVSEYRISFAIVLQLLLLLRARWQF